VPRPLALVTGGSSGIGLAIARALAADHDLALGYARDEERAARAEAELAAESPEAHVRLFRRALSGHEDSRALVEEVAAAFAEPPAVLVHAAGRLSDGLFVGSPFADHRTVLAEHLEAAMALAHLLLPEMYRRRSGRIVFLSSVAARHVKPGQASYAAAKAGLEGLTRALALEVAHRGVTVNAVAPGLIETPMTAAVRRALSEAGGPLRRKIPAGRFGRPEEVGALVRFLCSAEAAYITGAVLPIDGGRSLGDPDP
jgi:3-oxoacyl-[acyl-carrier protein] reductase